MKTETHAHIYIICKYTCTQKPWSLFIGMFFVFTRRWFHSVPLKALNLYQWDDTDEVILCSRWFQRQVFVLCLCSFQAISPRIRFQTNSIDQPNSLGLTGWKGCLNAITEGYLFWWVLFCWFVDGSHSFLEISQDFLFMRGKKGETDKIYS